MLTATNISGISIDWQCPSRHHVHTVKLTAFNMFVMMVLTASRDIKSTLSCSLLLIYQALWLILPVATSCPHFHAHCCLYVQHGGSHCSPRHHVFPVMLSAVNMPGIMADTALSDIMSKLPCSQLIIFLTISTLICSLMVICSLSYWTLLARISCLDCDARCC